MMLALIYSKDKGIARSTNHEDIPAELKNPRNLLWIDLTNPGEDDIDLLTNTFHFHPLAIEDAIFPQNQPKVDDYEDFLFLVMHAATYRADDEETVTTQELDLFVGKNYVVTIHADPLMPVTQLLQRCQHKPLAMQQGAGFLLHAIVDRVVDAYFPVVEQLEDRIEAVENQVLSSPDQSVLAKIVKLKKEVLTLRNFLAPQRKLIGLLTRTSSPFLRRATAAYFRDVYDHIERINSMIDTYRDILNSTMEAYLSVVSHRLNEIMKTLTIITTMLMPLSVITGFYGMNVKLPEFEWGIKGYFFVVGLLCAVVLVMVWILKHRKWI
jgi:magnesium transporter